MQAIAPILLGCVLIAASAQAAEHEADQSAAPTPTMVLKTGKERLGEKATDEQRMDDCKVPPDRQTWARPTACPWDVKS